MSITRYSDVHPELIRFLDVNGDGSGSKEANVDGSSTPVYFKLNAPTQGAFAIERLVVQIRDNGGAINGADYGNLASGLTNGVVLGFWRESDNALLKDYTDGLPVKNNADWGRPSYDVQRLAWGGGDEFLLVRWTFSRMGTTPLLRAGSGLYFGVKIQDNLEDLEAHTFCVEGYGMGGAATFAGG